jgi:putative DNA primase/helicase
MSTLDVALELVKYGFRLHPLQPRNKIPVLGKWEERATTSETSLRLWSSQVSDCNWGIATGQGSGIFVVDVDPKNGGDVSWNNLIRQHGEVQTVSVRTGSGGMHYYFKYPEGFDIGNNSGRLGKGIDVRGNNGQVVAPGSIHPNGNKYEWVVSPNDHCIDPPPQWILDAIFNETGTEDFSSIGGKMEKGNRNNSIYHAALSLARQHTTKEFAMKAIKQWVRDQGHHDILDDEIEATVESAYEAASKKIFDIAEKSDTLNAEILLGNYGEDLIYVPGMGWFHWNGKVWEPDPDDAVVAQLFIKCMKAVRDEAGERILASNNRAEARELAATIQWAIRSLSASSIKNAVQIASTFPQVRRTPDQIDPVDTLWYLNCNNGTLNLSTGELEPHKKEQMISKIVPVNYNPDAKCPFWESTFDLIFSGNKALTDFMQRALGYSITGAVDERCFFICWGELGANGKSTVLETVQDLLGPGYSQMSDMVVVTSSTVDNRVSSSLAKLQGARFVSMNEAEENQRLSEALIKQLTGGDTVQACYKYKNPFEYKPVFKLWIRTNEKPTVRSQNNAVWDRIKLIPFENSIPKDKRRPRSEIDNILREEREGILAWLVRGSQLWLKEHTLNEPKEVTAAVAGYRSDSDIVKMFFDECMETGPNAKCKASEAYQVFVAWCRDAGERYVMTRTKFTQRSRALTGKELDRSNGSNWITGVKLSTQATMYMA